MIWCTDDFEVWYLTNSDIKNYDEIKDQIRYEKNQV